MERAGRECSAEVLGRLDKIVSEAGVQTDYGRGKLLDTLQYTFSRDIPDLEMPNENWDWHFERGRHVLQREYNQILKRQEEGLFYECDKIWGFEQPLYEPARPGEQAKRMAQMLLEPFRRSEEEFFKSIGDEARHKERYASQKAVKSALANFDLCMRSKVKELRVSGSQNPCVEKTFEAIDEAGHTLKAAVAVDGGVRKFGICHTEDTKEHVCYSSEEEPDKQYDYVKKMFQSWGYKMGEVESESCL